MVKNDTQFMNNSDDKFEELLARWLSGELSDAELQELEAEEGQETLTQLKQVAQASTQLAPPPMDHDASWSRLAAAMEEEGDSPLPFTPNESSPTPAPKTGSRWIWYTVGAGIAATIVLLLLFVIPEGNSYNIELMADQASLSVTLPDQSQVELQSGSTLRYSDTDWDEQREVELEGEAYFEVTKGQRFSVIGTEGRVEVLGTRFIVSTSPDTMEVICYSGKVRVSDPKGKELTTLGPGSQFGVYKSGTYLRDHNGKIPTWAWKEIASNDSPLEELMNHLEEIFDIVLTCDNCEGRRITGTFSTHDLPTALDQVVSILGMTWKETKSGHYHIQ